jgi:hypothetical protein
MTIATAHMQAMAFHSSRYAGLTLGLGLWFLLSLGLGLGGIYTASEGIRAFALPVAIVTPLVVFALVYLTSRHVRNVLLGIDTRVLVLLHTWRMLGLGFLMLYAFDLLPAIFAFPAGIGDAAAAVWALVLVVGLYGGFQVSRRHLLAWNGFGLADFIIAVSVGTLSRYGFLQWFSGEVTMAPMNQFPLVLIPTFIVPLLAITHVLVYLQVKNGRALGTR